MDKLLKDAIADAKTVRETAMQNAKIALEEAFAPKLQSMLSARINEEDDEEVKDDDETKDENFNFNVDETKDADEDDAEEDETTDEAKKDDGDEDADDAEATDEELDLEAIIKELEAESNEEVDKTKEPFTKKAGDDAGDDVTKVKRNAAVDETKDDEEELDLNELLAELEAEDRKKDDEYDDVDEAKDADADDEKDAVAEVAELKHELSEYRSAVIYLKDKINEINLLNAKLLYTNKLFKKYSLTESQKVKILESLDRTKSVREVKLVYSTLMESFTNASNSNKKKISESFGFASKKSGGTKKAILEEGATYVSRFQQLANIGKKKN